MSERDDIAAGWGLLIAVGALVAYCSTATTVLTQADSPEFAGLSVFGGAAHPPGFPAMVLYLRSMSWLPAVNPNHAAALATALLGAATVFAAYLGAVAWGVRRVGAVAGALFLALNTQVWLVNTHPEAFALNNLFAALIILFAAPHGPLRGAKRVAMLGLLAGLALGNHPSIVLLAPLGLAAVVWGLRESSHKVGALVAAGALLFGVAGALYWYLLGNHTAVGWGGLETPRDVLGHFLREDYGTTQLAAEGESDPFSQIWFLLMQTTLDSFGTALAFPLLASRRPVGSSTPVGPIWKSPWFWLVAAWVACGPFFVSLFNAEPIGLQFEIVKRFHVLPAVVLTPVVALGFDRAIESVDMRKVTAGLVAFCLFGAALGGLRTQRVYHPGLEDSLRNTLRTLPQGAVLFGMGDHRYFGINYLQHVEQVRPDVVFIEPVLLAHPWYVSRLEERVGVQLPDPVPHPSGAMKVDLRATIHALLERENATVWYTGDIVEEIFAEYRTEPRGPAWLVLGPDDPGKEPAELVALTDAAFAQFEHRASPPEFRYSSWSWSVFNTFSRVWEDLAKRCEGKPCAATCEARRAEYPDL